MIKTKIICTLGPAVDNYEKIKALILNGMEVARFNLSHQNCEDYKRMYEMVKKVQAELGRSVATMMDTKGPKIRLGVFEKEKIMLKDGQKFVITTKDVIGNEEQASIKLKSLPRELEVGCKVYIDDGLLELSVLEAGEEEIVCVISRGGVVSSHKGVNLPRVKFDGAFINEEDKKDLLCGANLGFDFVAASFVRSSADVANIRELLATCGSKMKVIAKIENREGVDNIKEILEGADGVMVARGDLGIEIPFEELPSIQKEIVSLACKMGKTAIVATQMLSSMVNRQIPTRAESTDIANAVYDGASAVMLSEETAAGKYPIEALRTMRRIVECADRDIEKFGVASRKS